MVLPCSYLAFFRCVVFTRTCHVSKVLRRSQGPAGLELKLLPWFNVTMCCRRDIIWNLSRVEYTWLQTLTLISFTTLNITSCAKMSPLSTKFYHDSRCLSLKWCWVPLETDWRFTGETWLGELQPLQPHHAQGYLTICQKFSTSTMYIYYIQSQTRLVLQEFATKDNIWS